MLKIKNLHVSVDKAKILKGINLPIKPGEIHAVMGPNGSGKTTLASVLSGQESYNVTKGSVDYKNKNLLQMPPDVRAKEGLFLAFQYPVELPGVSQMSFLKTALNEKLIYQGKDPIDAADFLKLIEEKKKNEIFQMALLEPDLAILDETDSGLDIDALKEVSDGVNKLKNKKNAFIIITHYQRILHYIHPDHVHVMHSGKIVESGGKELAEELEKKGYAAWQKK